MPEKLNLNYHFRNPALLEQALTHPSYIGDHRAAAHYERMEFLGDAVLDMAVSEYLYRSYPDEKEGALAKRRAALVCGEMLALVARQCGIHHHMKLGAGEESGGGRENPANLENVLEAIIAAMYLDGGMIPVEAWVARFIAPLAAHMSEPPKDPKTALQEWAQSRKLPLPSYKVVGEEGPSHAPHFTVEASVKGRPGVRGEGTSKRLAEREAARLLMIALVKG